MSGTPTVIEAADAEHRDALVGRLFEGILGTMDVLNVYLGDRLGLYRALAEGGAATSPELAARAGIHERYAREWLEQQAVSGVLTVDDVSLEAGGRRDALPPGHAEVLTDRDSLSYLAYAGRFAACLGQATLALLDAFRTGGGVSWAAFGEDAREGQAEQGRPLFLKLLGTEWLPKVPDVHARLTSGEPARVA